MTAARFEKCERDRSPGFSEGNDFRAFIWLGERTSRNLSERRQRGKHFAVRRLEQADFDDPLGCSLNVRSFKSPDSFRTQIFVARSIADLRQHSAAGQVIQCDNIPVVRLIYPQERTEPLSRNGPLLAHSVPLTQG